MTIMLKSKLYVKPVNIFINFDIDSNLEIGPHGVQ